MYSESIMIFKGGIGHNLVYYREILWFMDNFTLFGLKSWAIFVTEMIYSINGDIFNSMGKFSFAQCISQDAAMFRGISIKYLKVFPELEKLRGQKMIGTLGIAVPVKIGSAFVYNLR